MYNLTTEKKFSGSGGIQTHDLRVTCPLLHHLSYRGTDLPEDGSNLTVDTNTGVVKESACCGSGLLKPLELHAFQMLFSVCTKLCNYVYVCMHVSAITLQLPLLWHRDKNLEILQLISHYFTASRCEVRWEIGY